MKKLNLNFGVVLKMRMKVKPNDFNGYVRSFSLSTVEGTIMGEVKIDSLKLMEEQIVQQLQKYHQHLGTKPWDYRIAAKDMSYQIGSLMKLMMQLEGERYRHAKTDAQIKEEIADELADMLSLILFISHELNIDLKEAWNNMLQSDENKFKKRSVS